jgi:hypothetical protein
MSAQKPYSFHLGEGTIIICCDSRISAKLAELIGKAIGEPEADPPISSILRGVLTPQALRELQEWANPISSILRGALTPLCTFFAKVLGDPQIQAQLSDLLASAERHIREKASSQ